MQPARRGNHLRPGAEHQVIGIAQDDLGTVLNQVSRLKGLDGPLRPDIHEDGRLNDTMIGRQSPQSCARARILF